MSQLILVIACITKVKFTSNSIILLNCLSFILEKFSKIVVMIIYVITTNLSLIFSFIVAILFFTVFILQVERSRYVKFFILLVMTRCMIYTSIYLIAIKCYTLVYLPIVLYVSCLTLALIVYRLAIYALSRLGYSENQINCYLLWCEIHVLENLTRYYSLCCHFIWFLYRIYLGDIYFEPIPTLMLYSPTGSPGLGSSANTTNLNAQVNSSSDTTNVAQGNSSHFSLPSIRQVFPNIDFRERYPVHPTFYIDEEGNMRNQTNASNHRHSTLLNRYQEYNFYTPGQSTGSTSNAPTTITPNQPLPIDNTEHTLAMLYASRPDPQLYELSAGSVELRKPFVTYIKFKFLDRPFSEQEKCYIHKATKYQVEELYSDLKNRYNSLHLSIIRLTDIDISKNLTIRQLDKLNTVENCLSITKDKVDTTLRNRYTELNMHFVPLYRTDGSYNSLDDARRLMSEYSTGKKKTSD